MKKQENLINKVLKVAIETEDIKIIESDGRDSSLYFLELENQKNNEKIRLCIDFGFLGIFGIKVLPKIQNVTNISSGEKSSIKLGRLFWKKYSDKIERGAKDFAAKEQEEEEKKFQNFLGASIGDCDAKKKTNFLKLKRNLCSVF